MTLPRLAAPRGLSQRTAALLTRAPAADGAQLLLPLDAAARPRRPRGRPATFGVPARRAEGPLLLVPCPPSTRGGEQRIPDCLHAWQCEDDWWLAGRVGQARCPAACPVWAAVATEEER